jgi:hypothetical protein
LAGSFLGPSSSFSRMLNESPKIFIYAYNNR